MPGMMLPFGLMQTGLQNQLLGGVPQSTLNASLQSTLNGLQLQSTLNAPLQSRLNAQLQSQFNGLGVMQQQNPSARRAVLYRNRRRGIL